MNLCVPSKKQSQFWRSGRDKFVLNLHVCNHLFLIKNGLKLKIQRVKKLNRIKNLSFTRSEEKKYLGNSMSSQIVFLGYIGCIFLQKNEII